MPFDANEFLDGLFQNPGAAPALPQPSADPGDAAGGEAGLSVAAGAPDDPGPCDPPAVQSISLSEAPYSALIDRLNTIWPTECLLTEEGGRLLDAMFARVCEAQHRGDRAQIQAAVNAAEQATRQLIAEQGLAPLDELLF
jgi:hypothetical protein